MIFMIILIFNKIIIGFYFDKIYIMVKLNFLHFLYLLISFKFHIYF